MTRRRAIGLATAWLFLVSACGPVAPSLSGTGPPLVPPGTGPDTLTILTYNVWHGLNTGEFWVTPSETPEQAEARLQFQVAQISTARPDLILLQEVNPLPTRAERYVKALAELGLDYDAVHQVDACGVRLHGDAALIPALNNGLVLLARRALHLRKLAGLKLSGDLGRCDSASGVQLEELRYALIGDITIPESGQSYLIANTHLHSGFEAGAALLGYLERVYRTGQLPRYPDFRWEIEQSRLRRIGELDTLARALRTFLRHGAYAGFAMGGDLNFESDFPEYEEAVLLRLQDAYVLAARGGELYTADPQRNRLIHHGQEPAIPASLQRVLEGVPPASAAQAEEAYRLEAGRPRRIDYVWLASFLPGYCLRQELFGTETNAEGFPASDHYGVLTTFSRTDGSCREARPATR